MGCGDRDRYIDNYCTTLRNLAAAGVDCVCYNFMPVFDWTRSDLAYDLPDGSNALIYDEATVLKMDPVAGELSLPGWDASYTKEGMKALLDVYKNITEEDLWNNLKYFLDRVIKVAEEVKVKMAIHPDDPPWSIFGLPRIITNKANIQRFLKLYDSPYNGLTLCSGSLGVDPNNNIGDLVRTFADRIHFAHIRNIKITGDKCFEEAYLNDDMAVEITADGVHLPDDLLKLVYKIKGPDKVALVTDSMRAAGMPEGSEMVLGDYGNGITVIIEDGVAKLSDRSAFAGSVAYGDRLVRNMVYMAGVPLPMAVKMASENPAKFLGVEKTGKLEPGYFADVTLFDKDINIKMTMVNGKEVYSV